MHELDGQVLASARAHALSEPYEETAGLIFNFDKLYFYPIKNNSTQKEDHFKLDKRVSLLRNKLHSVFHSHPASDAYPSSADMEISAQSKLPFLIYSCLYDNFLFFDTRECNVVRE